MDPFDEKIWILVRRAHTLFTAAILIAVGVWGLIEFFEFLF